jgi:hypothetical protein
MGRNRSENHPRVYSSSIALKKSNICGSIIAATVLLERFEK